MRPNLKIVIALSIGLGTEMTAWAQLPSGTVWTWGDNHYGQLGNGTICNPGTGTNCYSATPVQVPNLAGVVAVTGGFAHSIAVKSDGTVWTWGNNYSGELGNGGICPNQNGANQNTACYSSVPIQVPGLTGVTRISAGMAGVAGFTLALKSDGTVWAWGYGALGSTATYSSNVPIQVMDPGNLVDGKLHNIVAIAAGQPSIGLAIDVNGAVWAWGENTGNGTYCCNTTPAKVSSLSNITTVAGGASSSMAVQSNATLWMWGMNFSGTLGNGGNTDSYVPVQVIDHSDGTGLLQNVNTKNNNPNLSTVAGTGGQSLAALLDTSVRAWGDNQFGTVGNGTTTNSNVPVKVLGPGGNGLLTGIVAVAAGNTHSMGLTNGGAVYVWGDNRYGELGNPNLVCDPNTFANCISTYPVQVQNLSGVAVIGAGAFHNLAILPANQQASSDLTIRKTCTSNCNRPLTGSKVCYSITVINNGPDAAPNAGYKDFLPSPMGGGTLTDSIASLAAGASYTFTNVCSLILNSVSDGTEITNVAQAVSGNPDPNTSNNSSSYKVIASNPPPTLTCPANMTVFAMSASGATASYAPTVTDNTPNDVSVSCKPPAGSTFPIGTTPVVCTAADTGGATSSCGFNVTVTTANLAIRQSANVKKVQTGGTITYTIAVQNGGPGLASNVLVTETLPAGATLLSAQSDTFSCRVPISGSVTSLTCSKPGMTSGELDTIQITLGVNARVGSTMTNKVAVSAASYDPDMSNNSASLSTSVTGK